MNGNEQASGENPKKLFWACFIALTATSFAFIIRIMIMDDLAVEFGLDETQKGEIFGVGIWPFAISIVLFSLIIDHIGYGKAVLFAFVAHCLFAILTITATGYTSLYIASLLGGLAAGAIEAAINPIIATLFSDAKTKWLNMLHAGWPAGMVAAGLISIAMEATMTEAVPWKLKVGLIFIPVLAYGFLLARCKFPVSERVAAGVSHRDMLKEVGFLGALIAFVMMFLEVGRVFEWHEAVTWTVIGVLTLGVAVYVRSPGRPLFIILVLIMMPLAITELGTDSWITDLMTPEMMAQNLNPLWVLVYTTMIMMVLRLFAGPLVHRLSPLGLLATSSLLAVVGLLLLSNMTGPAIILAATVYGVGKTFFWPTMLGVVSERFPRGGALTLNLISGIGMLAAGVVGTQLLGNIQDREVSAQLKVADSALYEEVIGDEQSGLFGSYRAVEMERVAGLDEEQQAVVAGIKSGAKKGALSTVAIFPAGMLIAYLLLILWFRSKGGYKPVVIGEAGTES